MADILDARGGAAVQTVAPGTQVAVIVTSLRP
jgi:hypothetical protein